MTTPAPDPRLVTRFDAVILESLEAIEHFQSTRSTERVAQALKLRDDLLAEVEVYVQERIAEALDGIASALVTKSAKDAMRAALMPTVMNERWRIAQMLRVRAAAHRPERGNDE
jgi:hypothetical protein